MIRIMIITIIIIIIIIIICLSLSIYIYIYTGIIYKLQTLLRMRFRQRVPLHDAPTPAFVLLRGPNVYDMYAHACMHTCQPPTHVRTSTYICAPVSACACVRACVRAGVRAGGQAGGQSGRVRAFVRRGCRPRTRAAVLQARGYELVSRHGSCCMQQFKGEALGCCVQGEQTWTPRMTWVIHSMLGGLVFAVS